MDYINYDLEIQKYYDKDDKNLILDDEDTSDDEE